jgi:hypothetical protein
VTRGIPCDGCTNFAAKSKMHMSKKLRQTKLRRAHAKTQMHDQARATTSDKQSQISVATSIWCSSPVIIISMIVSYPEAIDIDATTPLCLVASTTGWPPIGKEQASANLQPLQSCPTNAFLRQLYSPTRSTLSCVAYLPAQTYLAPPLVPRAIVTAPRISLVSPRSMITHYRHDQQKS